MDQPNPEHDGRPDVIQVQSLEVDPDAVRREAGARLQQLRGRAQDLGRAYWPSPPEATYGESQEAGVLTSHLDQTASAFGDRFTRHISGLLEGLNTALEQGMARYDKLDAEGVTQFAALRERQVDDGSGGSITT